MSNKKGYWEHVLPRLGNRAYLLQGGPPSVGFDKVIVDKVDSDTIQRYLACYGGRLPKKLPFWWKILAELAKLMLGIGC